jgi:hypothetical protein
MVSAIFAADGIGITTGLGFFLSIYRSGIDGHFSLHRLHLSKLRTTA